MNQGHAPQPVSKSGGGRILSKRVVPLAALAIAVIVVGGGIAVVVINNYHSISKTIAGSYTRTPDEESMVIIPSGSFLMHPGYKSGSNGVQAIAASESQTFYVLSNMTDVHIYGSFTSTQGIFFSLEFVGPWGANMTDAIPVAKGTVWSTGVTKQANISISLPTPHNSANNYMYMLIFDMEKPVTTEIDVISPIVIAYNSA